jgi:hypothetical protein
MSGGASPVITRVYGKSTKTDSCARAVRLLLNFRESNEKEVTQPGGPVEAKGIQDARPAA